MQSCYGDLTAPTVLRMCFQLENQLFSISSPIAFQLEQVKQGIQKNSTTTYSFIEEKRQISYVDIVRLTGDLTPQEKQICRMRYTGQGKIEVYERMASTTDLQHTLFMDEQGLGQLLTKDAEEPVGLLEREDAEAPAMILVRGRRAKYPSFFQIGKAMNLSSRQVKTILSNATGKVRQTLINHKKKTSRRIKI